MCGIAGIITREGSAERFRDALAGRLDRIAHRGPDGSGMHFNRGVGLGHRRLAIQDLSDAASQPMLAPEASLSLVYNGEVYNAPELRRELEPGWRFRSRSDTEVILAAYRAWGPTEAFRRLNGIFSLALHDERERVVHLVRDPLGVKPLFTAETRDGLWFASEPQALWGAPGVDRDWDPAGIADLLQLNYCAAPRTALRGVRSLEPGEWLAISEDGLRIQRSVLPFWDEVRAEGPIQGQEEALLAEAAERWQATVRRQRLSDVPVSVLLSGGVDSSLVASEAAREGEARFFHFSFPFEGYDESAQAMAVAQKLARPVEKIRLELGGDELARLPETLARFLGEPTADASSAAFYLLSRAVARTHKVALSGDGADELFAGYSTYDASLGLLAVPGPTRGLTSRAMRAGARWLPAGDGRYPLGDTLRRLSDGIEHGFTGAHARWRRIFTRHEAESILQPDWRERGGFDWDSSYARYCSFAAEAPLGGRLDRLLSMDLRFYLPNDMLIKADRMSMAHGLEVRVPFLDLEWVRWSARLPSRMKWRGPRARKWLLRRMLERAPQGRIPQIRAKKGFSFPIAQLLRTEWRPWIEGLLSNPSEPLWETLDRPSVQRIWDEHLAARRDRRFELWSVLSLALWMREVRKA